ncbi:MAG: PUA domain-containing protein [Candidatus Bathyarchaeia archaeon]|jgi:ribosome biogenesis protein Nip4
MKAKVVEDFALQFGVKLVFNEDLLVQQDGRFFLLNSQIKPLVKGDFFYAGTFLGKVKAGKFFPSFNLLSMLAGQEANRIVVDGKAAWLFICGRDIFKKGILRTYGLVRRNGHVLVLNEFGECLGFGRVLVGFEQQAEKGVVAVANVLDVGDFLRRERGL